MGFNTVAVLYNDFTSDLAKDGRYGAKIAKAMRHWSVRRKDPFATHFGAGMVISQAHADHSQVVIVGHNSGQCAHEATNLDPYALSQMAECLERHGYKVTKPKKPRKKPASGIEAPAGRQDAPVA